MSQLDTTKLNLGERVSRITLIQTSSGYMAGLEGQLNFIEVNFCIDLLKAQIMDEMKGKHKTGIANFEPRRIS